MGVRVECDWCRQAIKAGERYVTVQIDGKIVEGHPSNEPKDVSGPARVYCGQDRYHADDDAAARGFGLGGPRPSCAQRMLAALNGNPVGRADMGLEWRLVPQVAPRADWLIDAPIDALNLSSRTRTALGKAGIASVHELARMTQAEWLAIPAIARKGAAEILKALHAHEKVDPKKLEALVSTGATA